ncbi:serine/threonine-protein kinase [Roseimaritima sediminicola]|uniref:serine/threonine-protein kinase n=1 Tax=Roseimaritima sediminicola TaxID=2662066 RepID=UPI0012984C41|nr:serine/threonine-protein kinase [Roseimaritima sediminicola]
MSQTPSPEPDRSEQPDRRDRSDQTPPPEATNLPASEAPAPDPAAADAQNAADAQEAADVPEAADPPAAANVPPDADAAAEASSTDPPAETAVHHCPQCGAALPPDAPAGLCPRCLLQLGFESRTEDAAATDPYRPPFVAPPPEHLAPHFPQLEILEQIGHGGMGVVYRARQKNLDRLVALKILRPDVDTDPTFAERFTREARLLGRLNHAHIVGIHDYGKSGPLFYLIMEHVDGRNLRQIEQTGQLTAAEALAIVPQICEALQYAHSRGVVHRDIKPENILIDTDGQVKIADFGLAKLTELGDEWGLTGQWQVMGTPHYMAPEQIERPLEVDHRADIYSLGVVLYEMLTGELPLGRFGAPSRRARVDVRLDEVVLRSLEKEPGMRYQRVTEVQTDLERLSEPRATSTASKAARQAFDTGGQRFAEKVAGIKRSVRAALAAPGSAAGKALLAAGVLEVGLSALLLLLAPLQGRETGAFFYWALTGAIYGVVAAISGLLLHKREYLNGALGGLAICLVPCSLAWLVRGPLALWGLWTLREAETRAKFTSPPWSKSQTAHSLGIVAELSSGTAKGATSTARRSMAVAAGLVGLRSSFAALLLAALWTALCAGLLFAVHLGWTQIFLPQRWDLHDFTAQRVDNSLGLPRFSITGMGTGWQPALPQRRAAVIKRVQFAVYPDGQQSPQRISIDLDRDQPMAYDTTASGLAPFTPQTLDAWVSRYQQSQAAHPDDPELIARQRDSLDNLYAVVQRLHQHAHPAPDATVAIARWLDPPPVASPAIASLLSPELFQPASAAPPSVSYRRSEGSLLSLGLGGVVWLFGVLGIGIRGWQSYAVLKGRRDNRVSLGQILLVTTAFSAVLLAGASYLAVELYQQGYLQLYGWLGEPEAQSIREVLQLALIVLAVVAGLAAWAASRPAAAGSLRWLLLPVFTATAVGLTVWFLSEPPWWNDWPLLLPFWLAVLVGFWILVRGTRQAIR